ncbi:hypothetical protein HQ524_03610 [Candidatus Uhrbacteria bacterium]|nr:hypothetical protein [Candidatus Uhrbacteria bacterium]
MNELSDRQLAANRNNALKGGVKTEAGKQVSKMNALKHGLLSSEVVLYSEDRAEFEGFRDRMEKTLKPEGELEIFITERIVTSFWRLKRLLFVERNVMEWHKRNSEDGIEIQLLGIDSDLERRGNKAIIANGDIKVLLRYETAIEKSYLKSLHELHRLQAMRGSLVPISEPVY